MRQRPVSWGDGRPMEEWCVGSTVGKWTLVSNVKIVVSRVFVGPIDLISHAGNHFPLFLINFLAMSPYYLCGD
jgi:hypothetical protein